MLTNSTSLHSSFKALFPQSKFTSAELKGILKFLSTSETIHADATDIHDVECGWFIHTEDEILKEFKINTKVNIKKRFHDIRCPFIHIPSEKVYLLFAW